MKRLLAILVMAIMLSVSFNADAQWFYGLRLGGVFTKPTHSSDLGAGSAKGGSGFAGGISFEWQMPSSGFAVGASLMYERRNIWRIPAPSPSQITSEVKIGNDYLSLPIDFKYKFPIKAAKELVSPYLLTGPDIAVRLNKADSRRFDIGWNVGAGIDIINFIQLSAGYRFGLNNISSHQYSIRDSGAFVAAAILFSF